MIYLLLWFLIGYISASYIMLVYVHGGASFATRPLKDLGVLILFGLFGLLTFGFALHTALDPPQLKDRLKEIEDKLNAGPETT